MKHLKRKIAALLDRLDSIDRVNTRPFVYILWILTVVFFAWLIFNHYLDIRNYLLDANLVYLSGTAVGYILAILSGMLGWSLIIGSLAPGIPRRTHNRIYALTLAARRLPGSLWYVGGRLLLYRKLGVPGSFTGFASGVELTVIIITGMTLGIAILPAQGAPEILGWVFIVLGVLLLLFTPSIISMLARRRSVDLDNPVSWRLIAGWMAAYLATWTSGGILVFFAIRTFTDIDPESFIFVLGSWGFAGALGSLTIFLPSTFGMTEVSLSLLLSQIMPLPLAGIIAIATRLLTTIYDFVLAAVIYFVMQDDFREDIPGRPN